LRHVMEIMALAVKNRRCLFRFGGRFWADR